MIAKNRALKFILVIVLTALTAMHVSRIFFIGPSFNQIQIIFFLMMFYAVWKENRKIYFLSFFFSGFLASAMVEKPDTLNSFVVLYISMLYSPNETSLIACIANIFTGYMVNAFLIQPEEVYNLPVGMVGNAGILVFFYFATIKKSSSIDYLSKTTPLSSRQLIILKYLHRGISRREMPDKIPKKELWKYDIYNFTFDIINSEISKIKKSLDLDSEFELGAWYESHVKNNRFTTNI